MIKGQGQLEVGRCRILAPCCTGQRQCQASQDSKAPGQLVFHLPDSSHTLTIGEPVQIPPDDWPIPTLFSANAPLRRPRCGLISWIKSPNSQGHIVTIGTLNGKLLKIHSIRTNLFFGISAKTGRIIKWGKITVNPKSLNFPN